MPSTYAHRLFGELVIQALPEKTAALIEKHRSLYDIGLHGPDILFYHRPLRYSRINQQGRDMHKEKGERFFSDVRQAIRKSADEEAALAYILGFICHFTLDSLCHPYVNRWEEKTGVPHVEIETEFDKMLLYEEGKDPWRFDTGSHLQPDAEPEVIGGLLGIPREVVYRAVADMKKYGRFFQTENTVVRGVVFAALKVSGLSHGLRGMFLNRRSNPACAESNRELKKKLEEAVDTAAELLENYLRFYRQGTPLAEAFARTYG